MKSVILIVCAIILSSVQLVYSQVVINKADFPLEASYVSKWYESAQNVLQAPNVGVNQSWDLSNVDVQNEYNTEFMNASGDDYYKNAISYQAVRYRFNEYLFGSNDFYTFDEQGYAKIGRRLVETEFSITQQTGGPNDKLKIVGGNSPFEGKWEYIKFPLNYEDTWTSEFTIPTNYELTVEGFGLKDTPGLYINYVTETRTVVGSGEITIPNKEGGVMTINALLLKVERTTIDSVFLGGNPAPPQLMAAFGLEQGGSASDESYIYYSPGYSESVASYEITSGITAYKSLSEIITSVESNALNQLSVYPNPVKSGSILNIIDSKFDLSNLVLVDQTGKVVL